MRNREFKAKTERCIVEDGDALANEIIGSKVISKKCV